MTGYDNVVLPHCRFIDGDRVAAALTYAQSIALRSITMAKPFEAVAVAALVREGEDDFPRLLSSRYATYVLERGRLSEFLSDPSVNEYLHRGAAIIVVFEEFEDYRQLESMFPMLPLSDEEERRFDKATQAILDEADEARRDQDYEPDCQCPARNGHRGLIVDCWASCDVRDAPFETADDHRRRQRPVRALPSAVAP